MKRFQYDMSALVWAVLVLAMAVVAPIEQASAVISPNGIDAQYIRINKTKPNNLDTFFHIGEVRALVSGSDQALSGMGASATSVHGVGGHGSAANLITARRTGGGSTWTRDDQNTAPGVYEEEALINLGSMKTLQEVQLLQRGDGCCQNRLRDFTVTLEDASNNPVYTSPLFAGTAPWTTSIAVGAGQTILAGGEGAIGTEDVGQVARFIRVQNNGLADRALQLSEIEGFAPGVVPNNNAGASANDIAGTTYQSQEGTGGHGSVNSVRDNNLETGGATWTRYGVGAGYTLDLGATQALESVRIWQRADGCCQDRLKDVTVTLFSDDGSGNIGGVLASQSFGGQVATNSYQQFDFANEFTIGADDTLKLEIDGANGLADLLSVGGGLGDLIIEAGASLEIIFLSFPTSHTTFQLLDFANVTGEFTNITAGDNVDLTNLYLDGTVLVTVPEPATATLAMLGLGGLLMRRKRAA